MTDKYAEVEWSGFEVVVEDEPRCDRNGVCNVEPGHGEGKDGVDGLRAGEGQKAEKGGDRGNKPNSIDGCASEVVHAVQDA